MAHQMLKFSSLSFYVLSFVFCFLIGMATAGLVGAGKGQMLAGGAIVFGYGVVGSVIGLVGSLFLVNILDSKIISRLNIGLVVLIACLFFFFKSKYDKRESIQEKERTEISAKPTEAVQ